MKRLVNIAPPGRPAHIVDIDDVSMITASAAAREVIVHSRAGGRVLASFLSGVDVRTLVETLRHAGLGLIPLREKYDDPFAHTGRAAIFINEAAFAGLEASETIRPTNGDPYRRVIVQIDGGETDMVNMSGAEEAAFRQEFDRYSASWVRIDAKFAGARFHNPGYAFVNPEKIMQIHATPRHAAIKFATTHYHMEFLPPLPPGKNIVDIVHDEDLRQAQAETIRNLAQILAQGNYRLAEISGLSDGSLIYLRPDDVQIVTADRHDARRLTLQFTQAAGGLQTCLSFQEEKQAHAALSSLGLRP